MLRLRMNTCKREVEMKKEKMQEANEKENIENMMKHAEKKIVNKCQPSSYCCKKYNVKNTELNLLHL